MEEKAVQECEAREDAGLEDIDESMKPTRMPKVNQSLVGKWLEVCVDYLTDDGTINRWCTRTVTTVSNGKNLPKTRSHCKADAAVEILFDMITERKETECSAVCELKASKWYPKTIT